MSDLKNIAESITKIVVDEKIINVNELTKKIEIRLQLLLKPIIEENQRAAEILEQKEFNFRESRLKIKFWENEVRKVIGNDKIPNLRKKFRAELLKDRENVDRKE